MIEILNPRREGSKIRIIPSFWKSDWHLTFLLCLLLVVIFVIYPMSNRGVVSGIVLQTFFSLILIEGATLVARSRTAMVIATTLAIATAAIGWVRLLFPLGPLSAMSIAMWVLFFIVLAWVILARVFAEGRITLHRIQGAVAAYLLLGVIWAGAYRLVIHLDPAALNLPPSPDESALMPRLVYFSFVTLTTVGYGDITPVDNAARSLAILEALTGQLFPAILIGRLVSLEVTHRMSDKD